MLHDASGETWRQTICVPAAGQLEDAEIAVSELGRFASRGGFEFRQSPRVPALHVIHAGEGVVRCGGRSWRAAAGAVFCFAPGQPVEYSDLPGKPWRYSWVNLAGRRGHELASRLGGSEGTWVRDDLPLALLGGVLDEIEAAYRSEEYSAFYPTLAAWRVLDALSPRLTGAERERHVASGVRGILDAQYAAPLKLGILARQLGVDRSTVFRQFHKLYGLTPKAYLDHVRLDHAAVLLRDGSLSVAETARRCGYAGAQRFAKAFAARFGAPPSRWRKREGA